MFEDLMFPRVYGRGLLQSIPEIAPKPCILVTMEELWPLLEGIFEERGTAYIHFTTSLELGYLERLVEALPEARSVVGVGGGRALDVAKFIAWRRGIPLFQAPTIISTNAAFTHRSGVRVNRVVKYIGWAVPELILIDYDVIQKAPPRLNRAGVGDVFCIHTALYDWKLAAERGRAGIWPWDEQLAGEARKVLDRVRGATSEIYKVSEAGIRVVMEAHRWTGACYLGSGWNPRPIEGAEHLLYYSLERVTRRHFVHGEVVCMGIILVSILQDNDPEGIARSILEAGVQVKPEEVGVSWEELAKAAEEMRSYARKSNFFYTIVEEKTISEKEWDKFRHLIASEHR